MVQDLTKKILLIIFIIFICVISFFTIKFPLHYKTIDNLQVYQEKTTHQPKVSVLITIYNMEKYLDRCLTSILNSSFKDIEIVCVDDKSNDNSLKILENINLII